MTKLSDRYKQMADASWFKEAYEDKSIDETQAREPSDWAKAKAEELKQKALNVYYQGVEGRVVVREMVAGVAAALDEARAEANLVRGNRMSYELGFADCQKQAVDSLYNDVGETMHGGIGRRIGRLKPRI